MSRNRLFNIVMTAVLIAVTVLTLQQALATNRVAHAAQQNRSCLISSASVKSVYVRQMGIWVPRTVNGPAGVDGGLIEILSTDRTCFNQGE